MTARRLGTALLAGLAVAGVSTQLVGAQGGGAWDEPERLSTSATNASEPHVRVARDGSALAVWIDSGDEGRVVRAAIRPPGGGFEDPVAISRAYDDLDSLRLVANAAGEAVAAWTTGNRLEGAIREPGRGFGEVERLSLTGHSAGVPSVALNARGDALVVWQERRAGRSTLMVARRSAGQEFLAPARVTPAGLRASNARVGIDRTGGGTVVFNANVVAGRGQATVIGLDAQGHPGRPRRLSGRGVSVFDIRLVVSASGAAVATWNAETRRSGPVQATYRPPRSRFGRPVTLERDALNFTPRPALDADGNAAVVWIGDPEGVRFATRARRGQFSRARRLTTSGNVRLPTLALDGQGEALVVWIAFNSLAEEGPGPFTLRAVRVGRGRSVQVSGQGEVNDFAAPDLSVNAAGDGVAVWVERDPDTNSPSGRGTVHAAAFDPR
jgi:hypothetical protein